MRISPRHIRFALSLCTISLLAATPAAIRAADPFVFRDVAADTGVAQALKDAHCHAAAWGDADGDGQIDLFVGAFAEKDKGNSVPDIFLWNNKGKFEPDKADTVRAAGRTTGAVLVDLDNDGILDLYVSNHTHPGADPGTAPGRRNILYRGLPGRKFQDVSDQSGAVLPEFTGRNVAVLDYDGDGLLDLFIVRAVSKSPGQKSVLLHNLGDFKFEIANAKAKLPDDVIGLGAAVADVTGNGWPDLFVGGSNRLFLARGDGTYREATELKGMLDWGFTAEDDAPSAGAAFGDFDRDGRPDLLIGHHPKRPWAKPVPLRLFRNSGTTPGEAKFEEVTEKVGLAPLPMKAPHVEVRDFDNDGWPDLYSAVVVFRGDRVYPLVYRNLGAKDGGLPHFQETALVHRPDFPDDADRVAKSGAFYDKLLKDHKITYMATGPSGDFDHDGRLDLFLASWFAEQPSMLLRNETPAGNWLDVSVVGGGKAKGLNRMGTGCVVTAYRAGAAGKADALLAREEIGTGYGYTCGQTAVAHLGLGTATICDVVIVLPHGKGEIIKQGVKANQPLRIEP